MWLYLVGLLLASSSSCNVYVINDVTAKEIHLMQQTNAPVYFLRDHIAILLSNDYPQAFPSSTLVASQVDKKMLYLVEGDCCVNNVFESNNKLSCDLLFQSKRFALVRARMTDFAKGKESWIVNFPQRPLFEKSKDQPELPEITGSWRIHSCAGQLAPKMISDYISRLCAFKTRYTFARNSHEVRSFAETVLRELGLTIHSQTFSINPYTIDYADVIKQNNEYSNCIGLIVSNQGQNDVYLPRMYSDGPHAKYSPDGLQLWITNGNYISWNTNPGSYHDWTRCKVMDNVEFDVMYYMHDFYKEGSEIWVCGSRRYYSSFTGMIFHSTDNGNTWNCTILPASTTNHISRFPIGDGSKQRLFCTVSSAIFYSDDGEKWTQLDTTIFDDRAINDMCGYQIKEPINGNITNMVLFIGETGLRIVTPDGGKTWIEKDDSVYHNFMQCSLSQDRIWSVGYTYGPNAAVIYSDNKGKDWTMKPIPSGYPSLISANPENKDEIWVSREYNAHSSDCGDNWDFYTIPTVGENTSVNVVGEQKGLSKPDELVIVCAHLDSISEDPMYDAEGADDDASGAAAVLACARLMSGMSLERTVQFVLFSGSKQSFYEGYGSQAYSDMLVATGKTVLAVVNLDTIGESEYSNNTVYVSDWDEGAALQDFIIACRDEYVPELVITEDMGYINTEDIEPFLYNGFTASVITEYNNDNYNERIGMKTDRTEYLNQDLVYLTTKLALVTALELAGVKPESQESPGPDKIFKIYPNPLRYSRNHNRITISGLVIGEKIVIYDSNGAIVWSCRADSEEEYWTPQVASGVYLYKTQYMGKIRSGKLAIIR